MAPAPGRLLLLLLPLAPLAAADGGQRPKGPRKGATVAIDLAVASRCPDAMRCETAFLPKVLAWVGSIADVRLNFIGELNPSSKFGVDCLHGDSECEGNVAQLCVKQHFPANLDRATLAKHSWYDFLRCVSKSRIPENTDDCLASMGVPADTIDQVHACIDGAEGRQLHVESVKRALDMCGHHSQEYRMACKSCTMFLQGRPVCVEDGMEWYNCSIGSDATSWIKAICAAYEGKDKPLACEEDLGRAPRVIGHSYASLTPAASAAFAVKYFRAELLSQGVSESVVRLPAFDDYRGGGMVLRFARTPGAVSGAYDVQSFVRSMDFLAGNLSDNSGYQWNQFFDSHLGFYVPEQSALAMRLVADGVPFWTGVDGGYYQSLYVSIPGTGQVVEVLGDFVTEPPLPRSHVRIASTQQFCTPFHGHPRQGAVAGQDVGAPGRRLRIPGPGGADMNKTTWAAPDPGAVVRFAVLYLGAAEIPQSRGPVANGQCATLRWARWPDGHEWHVVNTFSTDWVTQDHLSPDVPYNVSGFADYVESIRDLRGGKYDEYLDTRDILEAESIAPIERRLREADIPYLKVPGPPASIIVGMPGGLAVEVREQAVVLTGTELV